MMPVGIPTELDVTDGTSGQALTTLMVPSTLIHFPQISGGGGS